MTAELKDDVPLPPEINKYLTILSKDPGSMVFAPLAEAYRKAGMLDEAIATAQDGLNLHPNYVSGMVALGRACFEKGMLAEASEALEKVTAIAPDNIIAANILDEIKRKPADQPETLPIVPATSSTAEQQPLLSGSADEDETEVLPELEEITEVADVEAEDSSEVFQNEERGFEAPEPGLGTVTEVEDVEKEKTLGDIDLFGEEAAVEFEEEPVMSEVFEPGVQAIRHEEEEEEEEASLRKEITTETIADLYIKQGYFDKAIDIYQTIYDAQPENHEIKRKLDDLKKHVAIMAGAFGAMPSEMPEVVRPVPEPVEAEDQNNENIKRLESWLKGIKSERRKV